MQMKRCLRRCAMAALLAVVFTSPIASQPPNPATPQPRRLALLIAINDYSASRLPRVGAAAPERDWPDLRGAVNDANDLREMLIARHGFDRANVVTLTDQQATRAAIVGALRRLAEDARRDDVVFVYFAGHGSRVVNSKSDEPDKLDESIIPADSRRGADDIRDKELRRVFNAILDRGARLTVILDSCFSGSGARGLPTGARPRGIRPDLRDVRDGSPSGPRPENRGALVISATHDDSSAWETTSIEDSRSHGAFTWAWLRAMRDASPNEPAIDTFARAQARLRAEMAFQDPVIAGEQRERSTPFLGNTSAPTRSAFAVERVKSDGTIVVAAGWAHGLSAGSEIRAIGSHARATVTKLVGLSRCEARAASNGVIRAGMLFELAGWAAPPSRPLRISVPTIPLNARSIASFARTAMSRAKQRDIRWINDPTVKTPDFVLRRDAGSWELLPSRTRFTTDATALDAIAHLPAHASLFLQLPAPETLATEMVLGTTAFANVQPATDPSDADYILTGRFAQNRVDYAWVRPHSARGDKRSSPLPLHSAWITDTGSDTAMALRDRALRLHKIQSWNLLESPPQSQWPYRLALRRVGDDELASNRIRGGETYTLELRANGPTAHAERRHIYVFSIDSYGQSTLLFPVSGSVENHFPLRDQQPQPVIPLKTKFEIAPPYGIDTYVLLTTDEPLPNLWVLQWDGVRSAPETTTPLERLLAVTSSARRGTRIVTTPNWSIERLVIESTGRTTQKRRSGV